MLTAGAALTVAGLATSASVLFDRNAASELEQRAQRVFADALPGTPEIAPALQLRRALRDARHSRGELAEDDLLAMLGAVVEATGSPPETFSYRDGSLSLELTTAPASVAALERRGFKVNVDGRRLTLSTKP
jgi:general secretion pathway protein L